MSEEWPLKLTRTKVHSDEHDAYRSTVTFGLHYIRGNRAPYWSITVDTYRKDNGRWVEDSFGAQHDKAKELWPDLAKFVPLHLSYDDGEPLHALENAWYHAGGTEWTEGNVQHLANHLRIPEHRAEGIITEVKSGALGKDGLAWIIGSLRERWLLESQVAIGFIVAENSN